ncbi:hypothetical protein D7X33_18350 [Butyricicoccus sp. 1XD8-22]|nr:hypothetical protein D7X33_18350 [Butyricicoccus sp. 1XD8-22]
MNSNSLWAVINAKVQYDIQKKARGGGIIGFALFLLVFIMWDAWFYPIFDKIGIVDIATNAGLVQDTYVGTFFAVAAVLFVLLMLTTLLVLSGTILTTLFLCLPTPLQVLIVGPILLIAMPFIAIIDKFRKVKNKGKTKEETIPYQPKKSKTIEEYYMHFADETDRETYNHLKQHYPPEYWRGKLYIQDYVTPSNADDMKQLTYEEAYQRLNSAVSSLNSPHNYVVAYTPKDGGAWYILGPQPLPAYVSSVIRYYKDYSMNDVKLALDQYSDDAVLYVPAQPIYFYWDKEEMYHWRVTIFSNDAPSEYKTNGSSGMMALTDFVDFYYLNAASFPQYYRSNTLLRIRDTIIQSHELAYLIPIYFESELVKFATGQPNFMTAAKKIPNYETFNLLYMSAIESKLLALAKNGDMEAVQALRRMESSFKTNN